MSYLLDTDTCIAIIEDRPARARRRLAEARRAGATIAVPTVALFELWFGVARSAPARKPANEARLREFLSGPVEVLPFEAGDARLAGEIRETLRAAGTPIGAYDLLIAGQALARGLTVATANLCEFARVDGLSVTNWLDEGSP
ncbi:MAG TPA: PIN domain-containing protein [Geminicoccaceae bacterium]|nr:PIN domain-containing protein [Geminicoccaceae bacterium]